MTDNRYYKLTLSPTDAYYDYDPPGIIAKLQAAKWYRHPISKDFWISVPEVIPEENKLGYYFSPKTTLTLIEND